VRLALCHRNWDFVTLQWQRIQSDKCAYEVPQVRCTHSEMQHESKSKEQQKEKRQHIIALQQQQMRGESVWPYLGNKGKVPKG